MATRFYLRATADTTNITPTPSADWEDTSALVRSWTRTTKSGDTITTVNFADGSNANRDILFHQYISLPLTPGQTITGAQALQFVVRASEVTSNNNLFTALGVRVINGSTVQKTMLAVSRDDVEISFTGLVNRDLTATSAAGNYTTVLGDQLVIEIGYGGDPSGSNDHDGALSLGDSSATDLAANDTGIAANNPWVDLADTLTFQTFTGSGGGTAGGAATTSFVPAASEYVYVGSGGATAGGAAATNKAVVYSYTGSGGATSGGAATTFKTNAFPYTGSGGATAGGAATTSLAVGTITVTLKQGATTIASWTTERVTSSAITDYTLDITSGEFASISYPASDLTITVAGTTGGSDLRVYEIVLTAPRRDSVNLYVYSGSGGATSGGAASTEYVSGSATYTYSGSGGATSGGAATTEVLHVYTYAGSGGATSGGAAVTSFDGGSNVYVYIGSGGAVSGGAATISVTFAYTGAGGAVAGGSAGVVWAPTAPGDAVLYDTAVGGSVMLIQVSASVDVHDTLYGGTLNTVDFAPTVTMYDVTIGGTAVMVNV